jgi:hypothetical protein
MCGTPLAFNTDTQRKVLSNTAFGTYARKNDNDSNPLAVRETGRFLNKKDRDDERRRHNLLFL